MLMYGNSVKLSKTKINLIWSSHYQTKLHLLYNLTFLFIQLKTVEL